MIFSSFSRCGVIATVLFGLMVSGCGSSNPASKSDSGASNNDWPMYAGSAARLSFESQETSITPANAASLKVKWQYQMGAALTASPIVAHLDLPGGNVPVVFVQSWDRGMNAIRLSDGSRLWRFVADDQPGASFPGASSALFQMINGKPRLFFGSGETLYCLDAATGKEIWRFYAGTGCRSSATNRSGSSDAGADASEASAGDAGEAGASDAGATDASESDASGSDAGSTDGGANDAGAGLCGFNGERNEIESSPVIADGNVLFGMDINDSTVGKGGFYAVNAETGKLAWFFDIDSGKTCRPNPSDAIDHFDGYHTAAELGLPPNFFITRSGCNFDRTPNGCSNVWSSVSVDTARGLMFFTTGNCNVDKDPKTPLPAPPGPANEDAIVSLHFDGTEAWAWRPRVTCPGGSYSCINADLDFGGTPNLFSITLPALKEPLDVVGAGDKSGTYYVLDRTGVNAITGVKWNDADASQLPYWRRNVVPGGADGGIIGTAAVDPTTHRIYFSTAPGDSPLQPQLPSEHALNANDGSIIWQNTKEPAPADSSYGPTTATPSLVFAGSMLGSLRIFNAKTGARVAKLGGPGLPIASGIVVFNGIVLVGSGIGERNGDPHDPANIEWKSPSKLTAYCVPGSPGC